jgi:hypothetical protein
MVDLLGFGILVCDIRLLLSAIWVGDISLLYSYFCQA